MEWDVEITDEFMAWWEGLSEAKQESVAATVELLSERGPQSPYPYPSGIRSSRRGGLRELRIQNGGRPLRVFYAFDPRRTAISLFGRDKSGDDRLYERFVPIADNHYDDHLHELKREGLIRWPDGIHSVN